MEGLGPTLQRWEDKVARYNKKNAKVREVELGDDIKCSGSGESGTNARRLKKYDDVRVEIYTYFESS